MKDLSIIFLQETHLKNRAHAKLFESIFEKSFYISLSFADENNAFTGVALLIKRSELFSDFRVVAQVPGRAIFLRMSIEDKQMLMICVYAPADSNSRSGFFNTLIGHVSNIQWHDCELLLLAGDINCCVDPELDRSIYNGRTEAGADVFINMVNNLVLFDSLRFRQPTEKLFTFTSGVHRTQSRIDVIFGSLNVISNVTRHFTRSQWDSDHVLYGCSISNYVIKHFFGPSYYKANTALFNEFIVRNYINAMLDEFTVDVNIHAFFNVYESLKQNCLMYLKTFSRKQAFDRKRLRKQLEADITDVKNRMYASPQLKNRLKCLQRQVDALNGYYINQCMHNTHYRDFVCDRMTLGSAKAMQKRSANARYFFKLETTEGHTLSTTESILGYLKENFRLCFMHENMDEEASERFLSNENLPVLSNEDRFYLNENFSEEEIAAAIDAIEGKKSPGMDGLPIEFYKTFKLKMVPILKRVYECIFEQSNMPQSMRYGVITLLYKNKGSRLSKENWRPITLLNCDYKILTKMLALRMRKVSKKIVHFSQTCAVPDRNIQDSLLELYNIVEDVNYNNKACILLSVDHKSAFDVIDHRFIDKVLRKMGFGNNFVQWINTIYHMNHLLSSVIVNGYVSESFYINRGIRQGCPLSPILYIVVTEVLSCYIRHTPLLRGIGHAGEVHKITKYCDDTTIFVQSYDEIETCFQIFEGFKAASGSEISEKKTQILPIGSFRAQPYLLRYAQYYVDYLKLYGFFIHYSYGFHYDANWNSAISVCDGNLRQSIPVTGFSLFGRMISLTTYFLSHLWFRCFLLTPSTALIKTIERNIDRYLWYPSKKNFIKKDTLKLSYPYGGINYPDINTKVNAYRLSLLMRRWKMIEKQSWMRSFDVFYNTLFNLSAWQLRRYNGPVPQLYIDIRIAQLSNQMIKLSDCECSIFGHILNFRKSKIKDIYKVLVERKFINASFNCLIWWRDRFNFDVNVIRKSWNWSKTFGLDGRIKSCSYLLKHGAVMTRSQEHMFRDVPFYCQYCYITLNALIVENVQHIILFCLRSANLFFVLKRQLNQVLSSDENFSVQDFIFGRQLTDRRQQYLFNFLIQCAQMALHTNRKDWDNGKYDSSVESCFVSITLENLYILRQTETGEKFSNMFCGQGGIAKIENNRVLLQVPVDEG